MSTWISRIKLHNFKSYENAEFKFPAPSSNGSNLILIGALNGHGKTTLLEAIYLCLYGNDGEKALERATVNSEDKSRPLQNALFINAQPANTRPKWYEGTYYIKLEMDIKWNTSKGTNGISIERTWWFDHNRKLRPNDMQSKYFRIEPDEKRFLLDEDNGEVEEYAANRFPVTNHAQFFFFDGEKLKDTAQSAQEAGTWLGTALNDLVGVSMLDNETDSIPGIKQELDKYLRSIQRTEKKISQTEQTLQNKESEREEKNRTLKNKKNEFSLIESEIKEKGLRIDTLIKQLGIVNNNVQTIADLIQEKANIQSQMEQKNSEIGTSLKKIPMLLLPKNEMNDFAEELQKELNRLEYEAGKETGEPRLQIFLDAFAENKNTVQVWKILNDEVKSQINTALKESWQKLWYPMPEDVAEKLQHNYLSTTDHARIKAATEQTGTLFNDITLLQEEEVSVRNKLENIEKQISKARDIEHHDEKIKELELFTKETNELNIKKGGAENEINRLQKEVQELGKQYQKP